MTSWSIENLQKEYLRIELLSRPAEGEGYDWISAEATIDVGGFRGRTTLKITYTDLVNFAGQVHSLYQTLQGAAEFKTIENQIKLKLTNDGLGHLTVTGHLMDQAGAGNKLIFAFDFDQTILQRTMIELDEAIKNVNE
jgi:hypothetical protein